MITGTSSQSTIYLIQFCVLTLPVYFTNKKNTRTGHIDVSQNTVRGCKRDGIQTGGNFNIVSQMCVQLLQPYYEHSAAHLTLLLLTPTGGLMRTLADISSKQEISKVQDRILARPNGS